MKSMRNPDTITIRLESKSRARLEALAARDGVSLSDVVRQCCNRFIDSTEPGSPGDVLNRLADVPTVAQAVISPLTDVLNRFVNALNRNTDALNKNVELLEKIS